MYAFPQLMAVPALAGVGTMTIEWPTIGVVFAWMLIAALVGTGLGALRRMASQPPPAARPHTVPSDAFAAPASVAADHSHREAA